MNDCVFDGMPLSPSFWPEKATEWVALIAGSLGGLLGTFAFVMSILNYRRDRAKLRFFAEQESYYPDEVYDEDFDEIYIPDKIVLKLRVTNLGRRPIRIESAWALLPHLPVLLKLGPEKKDADPLGIVVTESEPTAIYVSSPHQAKELSIQDIVRFEVYDSAYREHRYYHRGYLRTRVSQISHWIHDYSRRRRIPKPRRVELSELLSSTGRPGMREE
jgi:hypothetical protein